MDKSKFFAAAEKAVQKGQIDKAIEVFEQIVRYDPDDVKALTRLADIRLKEEHYERAIEALGRIGELYSRDGFYSKAVAIYKRILKIDKLPTRGLLIETHERLATLYGQLGLVSDAMSHYAIVVDYYDQMNEKDLLLSALEKVSDLDPRNVDNQLKLIDLIMSQNRMELALEKLGQIEADARERASTADLVRVYEKFVDYFPRDLEKLKDLVELLISANEPKKALAKLQVAFKFDPRNPDILEMLVASFLSLKQMQKARAVQLELLKLYRELGQTDKATALEEQIKNPQAAATPETAASQSDFTRKDSNSFVAPLADPVESLVKAMPLSVEEKKVITECDVYLKYGLSEKVYELLRSKLPQFPRSLALRWKLKVCSQQLKRDEEAKHLLSEIILLAREDKLELWKSVGLTELKALDPHHPSLEEPKNAAPVAAPSASAGSQALDEETVAVSAQAPASAPPVASMEEVDASDVSIVLDEDFNLEMSAVSEISFQEVAEDLKKEEEKREAHKPEPSKPETSQSEPEPPPQKGEQAEPDGAIFLSEADFSPAELQDLDKSLAPTRESSPPVEAAEVESPDHNQPIAMDDFTIEMVNEDSVDQNPEKNSQALTLLDEADFYEAQGLFEEALQAVKTYREKNPKAPGLEERIRSLAERTKVGRVELNVKVHELEALGRKMKMQVQADERASAESAEDFFDLAGELQKELADEKPDVASEVKDVFNAFKKGVAATIATDDWQTHLDLGIAYREMMLLDDALEEFRIVSTVADQRASAFYQMGLTEVVKEDWAAAEKSFLKALDDASLHPEQKTSIQYELAVVLLKQDQKAKARDLFAQVLKSDPTYREASECYKLCS